MICHVHNIPRTRLLHKAAQEGWSRDLISQVRAEVNERLYVNRRGEVPDVRDNISSAAQVIVETIYQHRRDISDLRNTATKALDHVNALLDLDLESDDGEIDKSQAILRQVQAGLILGKTQGVVGALDVLASAYQRIVAMERQAFGLEGLAAATPQIESEQSNPAATVQVYLPANHREPALT
jgi:hypothetical protein